MSWNSSAFVQCKIADCALVGMRYLKLQECSAAIRHGVIDDAHWAVGRF